MTTMNLCITHRTVRGVDVDILWSAGEPHRGLGRVTLSADGTYVGLVREVGSRWVATSPSGVDVALLGGHANQRLAIERLVNDA
jgi:hypothetical protein